MAVKTSKRKKRAVPKGAREPDLPWGATAPPDPLYSEGLPLPRHHLGRLATSSKTLLWGGDTVLWTSVDLIFIFDIYIFAANAKNTK